MSGSGPGGKPPAYTLAGDKTLTPFLRKGEVFVGERAAHLQRQGRPAAADDVRVAALPSAQTTTGGGLHEVLPTSERNRPHVVASPALQGVQMGARTTPALTPLRSNIKNKKTGAVTPHIGGHTGTFLGNQGTRGQADAHDHLRRTAANLPPGMSPVGASVAMMIAQISATPTGMDLVSTPDITGFTPALQGMSKPIEPPMQPAPIRNAFAAAIHRGREQTKRRVMQQMSDVPAAERPHMPPLSPKREPMDISGSGGDYVKPSKKRPRSPSPPPLRLDPQMHKRAKTNISATQSEAAQRSAHMSQPMRVEPRKKK